MAIDPQNNLRLEIGHVLFIDLVGYSKLLIEEQEERLRRLTDRDAGVGFKSFPAPRCVTCSWV
jgi:hypothetical protein